ncbi:beta-1,3-galactosyltransferase 5-like [Panonychus citri]|uniref:beta-1,3-galactosyltransferase 5-like n=1 Tax=Panonychus citri TaxID=50023 RepID=UPI002307131A|nr:beta-1,3-galactosyltransferase 5-like [Panonychus citri]
MNRWARRYYPLMITTISLTFVYFYSKVTLENEINDHSGQPEDVNQPVIYQSNNSFITINDKHRKLINPYKPMRLFQRSSYQIDGDKPYRDSVSHLLDMDNFTFIKNCSTKCLPSTSSFNQSTTSDDLPSSSFSDEINLLAFVHSAPFNFDKRRIIRSTWASRRVQHLLGIKVIFLLGVTNSSSLQSVIDTESAQFGDLVQGNFADTYANLTYKHLMGYKWVLTFCREAKFIMKIDDDAYVDIFRVVSFLRTTFHPPPTTGNNNNNNNNNGVSSSPMGIISCSMFPEGVSVKRKGKWKLTHKEYPFDVLPAYCSGIGYFITPDVIQDLYNISPSIKPFLWIDDLFITGILVAHLPIRHQPINFKFTYDPNDLRKWLKSTSDRRPSPYIIGDIGDVSDWESFMIKLWEKTSKYLIS